MPSALNDSTPFPSRWRAPLRTAAPILACFFLFGCAVAPARVRLPEGAVPPRLSQTGIASWYGPGFHGKPTASGEVYNQNDLTAAHQTLPLGSRVMVTNLENGKMIEVLINDRGPFAKGRIIDLSFAAAHTIDMIGPGTSPVRIDILDTPVPILSIRETLDYTLQLGSFSRLENARQLHERLAASFDDVRISPLQSRDSTYYRVHVGSFSSRAAAEEQARSMAHAGYSVVIMEK